jgi:hypothetical protein
VKKDVWLALKNCHAVAMFVSLVVREDGGRLEVFFA